VHSPTGRIRLPPAEEGTAPVASYLVDGEFEITVRNWEISRCRIIVAVKSAPSIDEQTPEAPQTQTATKYPLRLNPATKEFVTALVLCKPKLEARSLATPMPTVPELTRQVLETTGSHHLLREFDEDPSVRTRLTGRIHEHLKQLRAKLNSRGLAPPGALAPSVLADVLINNDIIMPSHLALLNDPAWLDTQAELWWS
jgi:hypothetical protein